MKVGRCEGSVRYRWYQSMVALSLGNSNVIKIIVVMHRIRVYYLYGYA